MAYPIESDITQLGAEAWPSGMKVPIQGEAPSGARRRVVALYIFAAAGVLFTLSLGALYLIETWEGFAVASLL